MLGSPSPQGRKVKECKSDLQTYSRSGRRAEMPEHSNARIEGGKVGVLEEVHPDRNLSCSQIEMVSAKGRSRPEIMRSISGPAPTILSSEVEFGFVEQFDGLKSLCSEEGSGNRKQLMFLMEKGNFPESFKADLSNFLPAGRGNRSTGREESLGLEEVTDWVLSHMEGLSKFLSIPIEEHEAEANELFRKRRKSGKSGVASSVSKVAEGRKGTPQTSKVGCRFLPLLQDQLENPKRHLRHWSVVMGPGRVMTVSEAPPAKKGGYGKISGRQPQTKAVPEKASVKEASPVEGSSKICGGCDVTAKFREPLSFAMRLRIALDSAQGILYLHTEADPPIFHRDIKASNILLNSKFTAKVADFGLSLLAPVPDGEGIVPGHVSTMVKGTPGYLDPEYFLTHNLTDKSDVYSLGVVFLELLTGMQPILHGKNIVREVNAAYQSGITFAVIDNRIGSYPPQCVKKFMELALRCCRDETEARPSMLEVVRELEDIWHMMPESDAIPSGTTGTNSEEVVVTPPSTSSSSISRNHPCMYSGEVEITLRSSSIPRNPYVLLDISGSNLLSDVDPTINPR
ncbi:hypothetical protein HHK36_015995 [Tetracentron sinense]|uniref:non-specific serine/threonine protein kinase n=1 Tax=Tetracentron sinense TaxID=13715 RepID=A0A834Z2Q0_TETSI|nr:hypothetical protein HHK36_015995 [Tetracentron sinense]